MLWKDTVSGERNKKTPQKTNRMNTLLKSTTYVQPSGLPNRYLGVVDRALKKAGQHCFKPESVAAYRKEVDRRFRELNPLTGLQEFFMTLLRRNTTLIWWHEFATFIATMVGGLTLGVSLIWLKFFTAPQSLWLWILGGFALAVSQVPAISVYANLHMKKIGSWKRVPLRKFKHPLPEEALATVMELVRFCPDAQERMVVDVFMIDDLPDPILGIRNDRTGEIHWIEAWNEPDFMRERTAP